MTANFNFRRVFSWICDVKSIFVLYCFSRNNLGKLLFVSIFVRLFLDDSFFCGNDEYLFLWIFEFFWIFWGSIVQYKFASVAFCLLYFWILPVSAFFILQYRVIQLCKIFSEFRALKLGIRIRFCREEDNIIHHFLFGVKGVLNASYKRLWFNKILCWKEDKLQLDTLKCIFG